MVEWKSAKGHGARCAWIALSLAWVLLAAAPLAHAQRSDDLRDDLRTAKPLQDAYPLEREPSPTAAPQEPATSATSAMEAAVGGSDGAEQAALLLSLALLGGGVTGWLVALRRPRSHAVALSAPLVTPVRSTTPRLWAPSTDTPPAEPVPPAADAAPAAPAPAGPVPPEPDRAWAAEIEWHLVDGASQFSVTGRVVEGEAEPVVLGASSLLEWPPAGARSVQALTDAVKALESTLVAAGWTPLPHGSAWYTKRFTWQPGAQPPLAQATAAGRMRHRELYAAEYDRQVERTVRLREEIAARLIQPGRRDHAVGAPSD